MGKKTMMEIVAEKGALRDRVLELCDKGLSPDEIARRLGVTLSYVRDLVTKSPREPMTVEEVRAHRWRMYEQQRNAPPNLYGDPPPGRSALDQRRQT